MTSNLGSQYLTGEMTEGARRQVTEALREHFRPEFLNRIDEIIFFHALDRAHTKRIVDIQIAGLMKRLEERKIHVQLTDAAKEQLANGLRSDLLRAPAQATIQRRLRIRSR
jgi:ATP-dependent Clp protease ATP-binding subunit ClpB